MSQLRFVLKEHDILTNHFSIAECDAVILRWKELLDKAGLSNKEEASCIEGFEEISGRSVNRYKKHILGIYLSQGMDRHGLCVFELWRRIILKRKMSRFTKKEEELILNRVEELGKSSKSFQVIAKELGRFYTVSIRNRYKQLTQKTYPFRKGPWTTEEDEVILNEVFKSGENAKTFAYLAEKTGRKHCRNIKCRYFKLKYNVISDGKREFTPYEQELLIRLILEKYSNIELKHVKPTDAFLTEHYETFKRDSSVLEKHWLKVILPALLSYELGILNDNWQLPLIKTLYNWTESPRCISSPRDIDYTELLTIFPGQTKQSIQYFVTVMCRNLKVKTLSEESTFREILEKALEVGYLARSPTTPVIERNRRIVKIYQKILREKSSDAQSKINYKG